MFYTVYNYQANFHFADDELGQIIVLHSYNIVTLLEKRLNAGHQSTLNFHYQTRQILMVPCNCNIKDTLLSFHTNTHLYLLTETNIIHFIDKQQLWGGIRLPLLFRQLKLYALLQYLIA